MLSPSLTGPVITLDPSSTGDEGWEDFVIEFNEFCSQRGGLPLLNQTRALTKEQVALAFGGRLKSPHSVDVPFVFDTLHVIGDAHRRPGDQVLADRVSATWATFARTGKPDNAALPAWPAYTAGSRATMILDDTCKVVADLDGEVRDLWIKVASGGV